MNAPDKTQLADVALDMAARQRDISVSEFFVKNRHLLGFDTPVKALVTAVKEAVDNALDACEEAGILPETHVQMIDRYAAELPGIDEKNVEVKVAEGIPTIKGEKQEKKEEKKKDCHLQERRYGSFERSFQIPDSVDTDKIEASFKKGVLTVVLPKKAEARQAAEKIDVKAA